MENEKQPPVFVQGLFTKMPSDKAPDYILLQQSFKPNELFKWGQEHQDEKGWVNITIKRSKNNTIYAELDTWKPKAPEGQAEIAKEYNDNKYKTSPSPELPNGVDARNHVFTTDAEREKMDKEALDAMDNIPF